MKITGGKGTGEPLRFEGPWGIKFPLPSYGPAVLLFAALVGAGLLGYVYLREHMTRDDQNAVRVKASELEQLNESAKHFGELPAEQADLYPKDDPRGVLTAAAYNDGCVLIHLQPRDASLPIVNYFYVTRTRLLASPPPRFTENVALSLESAAWAQGSPGPGQCIYPHSGEFTQSAGERSEDGCFIKVTRTWQDSCSGWLWYDACRQVWSQQFNFTRCVH